MCRVFLYQGLHLYALEPIYLAGRRTGVRRFGNIALSRHPHPFEKSGVEHFEFLERIAHVVHVIGLAFVVAHYLAAAFVRKHKYRLYPGRSTREQTY